MSDNKPGRPTKLTPDLQQRVVTLIQGGNYMETAAAAVGICKASLYKWLKRGARSNSGIYRSFVDAVEKAAAEAEMRDVIRIDQAIEQGVWQAAAWRLERKHFERWGRRERREITGPGGGPIQSEQRVRPDLSSLTPQERVQLATLLQKAKPAEAQPVESIDDDEE